MSGSRHLSQAISEGERISVLVEVRDAGGARAAADQGATGIVLRGLAAEIGADAVVVAADGDDRLLEQLVEQASALGLECVVRVGDEDELERVLGHLDPEILLLVAEDADEHEGPLDRVLALLPDVPAGKLAIAELAGAAHGDVRELERAGVDAVLVSDADVRSLVAEGPPDV